MARTVKLSESGFNMLMLHSACERIDEEDGAIGGVATAGATSASSDRVGAYDVPFGMQSRDIYNPKGSKKNKTSNITMDDALSRKDGKFGSISMPIYRTGTVSK